ncbi:MAG: hypothetical protein HY314_08600 [Acidobacteria bacterium]|nr:hypothetical protein [Acidobacteriota bacterium]
MPRPGVPLLIRHDTQRTEIGPPRVTKLRDHGWVTGVRHVVGEVPKRISPGDELYLYGHLVLRLERSQFIEDLTLTEHLTGQIRISHQIVRRHVKESFPRRHETSDIGLRGLIGQGCFI